MQTPYFPFSSPQHAEVRPNNAESKSGSPKTLPVGFESPRLGWNPLAGGIVKPDDRLLFAAQRALAPGPSKGTLRSVNSQAYKVPQTEQARTVSSFLTRIYDPRRVNGAGDRMAALQLMSYYNQSGVRQGAIPRFFDGIIDMDLKALQGISKGKIVDEMLLVVFNDWDHGVDKYLEILQSLVAVLQPTESSPASGIPDSLARSLQKVNLNASHVAVVRRNAFAGLLNPEKKVGESQHSKKYVFMWPQRSESTEPAQIIAAIRQADFDTNEFFGHDTLRMVLQSPGIFFCTNGMQGIQTLRGPATLRRVSDFIITNSRSYLQLRSVKELHTVLRRFDRLALIVCKGADYDEKQGTSPLRDILFDSSIDIRRRMGDALPVFFVQEEQLAESHNAGWDKLRVASLEKLQPESLEFLAKFSRWRFPADLISRLKLLPVTEGVRLTVLERVELLPDGTRGGTLEHFSARVLLFPAPTRYSDKVLWSRSFGMRLVDFLETSNLAQPLRSHATGWDLQQVYERHFGVTFAGMQELLRQKPFAAAAATPQNKAGERVLVVVVLPPAPTKGKEGCERAVFHAAHANSNDNRVQYVTVVSDEAAALVEELRFSVWRHFKQEPPRLCEVYVFHGNGRVAPLEIDAEELQSPKEGWRSLFLDQTNLQEKPHSGLPVAHPTPEEFRTALVELRAGLQAATFLDPLATLRSPMYGTSGQHAPWFLWLPAHATVPYIVHVQQPKEAKEQQQREGEEGNEASLKGVTLLLLHDSSCGMTTNSLKAFRLLVACQKQGSLPASVGMVEYDLSDSYLIPAANGQRLRSHGNSSDVARRVELYARLEPFLQDVQRLQAPQFISLNSTHVISTIGTSHYYMAEKGTTGGAGLSNGYVQSLISLVSHVVPSLNADSLSACVHQAVRVEREKRARYRHSVKNKKI
ncbi:hypothetical protein DQ04_00901040 [Trypanosoma grayi]|uniref:hypothetical protein n=1 Tax=Trypanosoma grayi TaxID=71804 RepID=UPI0004F4B7D5|nr:hypothetical protein DQ04_00901040 [Trypanosoma grayi]KEG13602.1 hypothetical protein DQ04_00901040 [Trypanosoma grayi]